MSSCMAGSMEGTMDLSDVFQRLQRAMSLRAKYTPCAPVKAPESPLPPVEDLHVEFHDGLAHIVHSSSGNTVLGSNASFMEFSADMGELFSIRTYGSMCTFCFHRLQLLKTKFELYIMANFDQEMQEQQTNPHRDFYNVRKVDTHVHHSAAMNAKHMLRFIKSRVKRSGEDVVLSRKGEPVTLRQLFLDMGISHNDLCLDKMNVAADQTVFQRFDRFNLKYNPLNQPELRTIFLKTDNEMRGRYLAEITRELLDDLEEAKYQHTEWRLSIYGRNRQEWFKLSQWVLDNKLVSNQNRWMIQVPRLYSVYKASGELVCFQDMLDNIFLPMFEATLYPEKHVEVAKFLSLVSGLDSVDDESKSTEPDDGYYSSCVPSDWNFDRNPSYKYYNFYLQSNLRVLNCLRAALGLNQFNYRPHAGEAGDVRNLDTAFLLADGIAHGLNLRKSSSLQYLYYLCGIGIAMSPCSNNNLFLSYQKTPFLEFFMRGLNVSLSTDDPLMFHQTKEPLMEEYSLAKQFFRLSSADLCELARNSVLQSGFSQETKAQWIGTTEPFASDILKTNVPHVRLRYRKHCWEDEMHLIFHSEGSPMEAFRHSIPHPRARQERAARKLQKEIEMGLQLKEEEQRQRQAEQEGSGKHQEEKTAKASPSFEAADSRFRAEFAALNSYDNDVELFIPGLFALAFFTPLLITFKKCHSVQQSVQGWLELPGPLLNASAS